MSNVALHGRFSDESITVRLPAHLLERLRHERSRLAEAAPGTPVTISDVVRGLLLQALDAR